MTKYEAYIDNLRGVLARAEEIKKNNGEFKDYIQTYGFQGRRSWYKHLRNDKIRELTSKIQQDGSLTKKQSEDLMSRCRIAESKLTNRIENIALWALEQSAQFLYNKVGCEFDNESSQASYNSQLESLEKDVSTKLETEEFRKKAWALIEEYRNMPIQLKQLSVEEKAKKLDRELNEF